jgi:hypothetical protein
MSGVERMRIDASGNVLFSETLGRPYGAEKKQIVGGKLRRVDNHEYTTEAKDLPIEVCRSMWIIKYGDGPIDAKELVEQDDLIWEIGNRLFWAGILEHHRQLDTYTCKS